MAVIGTLAVNIVAKTEAFTRGIESVQKKLRQFNNVSGWMRTVAGGFIARQLSSTVDTVSQLVDMSQATGIAVDTLDFLGYSARQTGQDISAVIKGVKALILKGISPDRLNEIAAKLNAITDPAKRARMAMSLLGNRAGLALLPMLRQLPELKKRFIEIGGGVSTAVANKMDSIGDALVDVQYATRNAAIAIATALQPTIISVTDAIIGIAQPVKDFILNHQTMVKWVAMGGLAIATVTPLVWSLNQALTAVKLTLEAINFVVKSGIVAKLAALAMAHPVVAGVVGGGAAVYGGYKAYQYYNQPAASNSSTPNGDAATQRNTQMQVEQQKRTNVLLEMMARGGGGQPVMIAGSQG